MSRVLQQLDVSPASKHLDYRVEKIFFSSLPPVKRSCRLKTMCKRSISWSGRLKRSVGGNVVRPHRHRRSGSPHPGLAGCYWPSCCPGQECWQSSFSTLLSAPKWLKPALTCVSHVIFTLQARLFQMERYLYEVSTFKETLCHIQLIKKHMRLYKNIRKLRTTASDWSDRFNKNRVGKRKWRFEFNSFFTRNFTQTD